MRKPNPFKPTAGAEPPVPVGRSAPPRLCALDAPMRIILWGSRRYLDVTLLEG